VKNEEINETDRKIKTLKRQAKKLVVTEHAILRYLVRVKGLSLSDLKDEILNEKILSAYVELASDGKYPSGNGYRVVIKDNAIVTVET